MHYAKNYESKTGRYFMAHLWGILEKIKDEAKRSSRTAGPNKTVLYYNL